MHGWQTMIQMLQTFVWSKWKQSIMLLENESCCNLSIEACKLLWLGFSFDHHFRHLGVKIVSQPPHVQSGGIRGELLIAIASKPHGNKSGRLVFWSPLRPLGGGSMPRKGKCLCIALYSHLFSPKWITAVLLPISRQATMPCSVSFQHASFFSLGSQTRGAPSSSHTSVLPSLVWPGVVILK